MSVDEKGGWEVSLREGGRGGRGRKGWGKGSWTGRGRAGGGRERTVGGCGR